MLFQKKGQKDKKKGASISIDEEIENVSSLSRFHNTSLLTLFSLSYYSGDLPLLFSATLVFRFEHFCGAQTLTTSVFHLSYFCL